MQSKRYPFVPFLIPILLFAFILGIFPFSASAQDRKDRTRIDQLRQKAWSQGKVQVIIRFAVPDIEALTAASAQFGKADLSKQTARERMTADVVLIKAVEYGAWKVVAELQGTDYEEVARFDYIPYIAIRVSPNALAVLEASSDVLNIEEDVPEKLIEPVEDPGASAKAGSSPAEGDDVNQSRLGTSAELIGAKAVWNMGITGSGWYVAILDTGIRRTHQFFTGKTIVEACRALGRDGSAGAGDCPNGLAVQNGFGSAVHYPSSYSGYDHGTHVAGIAAGNYGSLAGIAKGANIIAVKIFSKFTAADCGGSSPCVLTWNSDQLAGLNYIYSIRGSYNIAAINMSLGGGKIASFCDSDARKAAIDLLRQAGIATVISTGNDGYCGFIGAPGCISSAVSVGSTTKSDQESSFSNWSATLQRLFAPGSSITSSTGGSDSSYESWNGTSMAAPHVTGAWALLKQAYPSAGVTTLLNALQARGKAIYSPCDSYGTPISRIQVDKLLRPFPPTNVIGSKALNRSFSQAEYIDNLSWQANPLNAELGISSYRVYSVSDTTYTLLAEVSAADSLQYAHRKAGEGANQYAITTVTSRGWESDPALVTVQ